MTRLVFVLSVLLGLTTAAPATSLPAGGLAFLLAGDRALCSAFYWRPVPGQAGRAYFISAGHCYQERYVRPSDAKVAWAKVPGDRPTFLDVLIGEVGDTRVNPTYPSEALDDPKAGDVHVLLVSSFRGTDPVFEPVRVTFKQSLAGDAYVYDADSCVSHGYSGAPVLTPDGRLVGVAILGNSKMCQRVYVFPMPVLYALRPDLKPQHAPDFP